MGLIATDGCLSSDRKTVAQVSKDRDLLETFKACIGSEAPITRDQRALRVQVADVAFYDWLLSIGLTPRKSWTLGALAVPEMLLLHTVRGLLDGDGCIYTGVTVPNRRRYPGHFYQRLTVRFHSASERHIDWLRAWIEQLLGLKGWVTVRVKDRCSPYWILRYSKHESILLLEALYAEADAPRRDRKYRTWVGFRDHGMPTRIWSSRRSGEIGTRDRLKSGWAKALEGSSPSSGTVVIPQDITDDTAARRS